MGPGISTIFFPETSNELCIRLNLLLQGKQAGYIPNIIDEEIAGIADKLLQYKCISTKQHKILLFKCLNYVKKNRLIEIL